MPRSPSRERPRPRPDPTRPPQARTKYTREREERKEKGTPERGKYRSEREERKVYGTPEKPRTRRREDNGSPEPRKERERVLREERVRERERERRRYEEEYAHDFDDGDEGSSGESLPPPPTERRHQTEDRRRGSPERKSKSRVVVEEKHRSTDSESTVDSFVKPALPLSLDSLAQLDAINEKDGTRGFKEREKRERAVSERKGVKEKVVTGRAQKEKAKHRRRSGGSGRYDKYERRRVSGPLLEEGRGPKGRRGGYVAADERGRRKWWKRKRWITFGLVVLVLLIVIVAVVVSKKKSSSSGGGRGSDPNNDNLSGVQQGDIPQSAKNTVLDPFTWYDTADFNVTYTNETVGGLPIMGLNSTWNDTTKANQFVPALDKPFAYGQMPIRGVNLGGWLSIEPFITPSLFNTYKPNQGIVDEYTLCKVLGPSQAAKTLEKHYAQFITEADFQQIQAAGFDHVRIPYSYWAVTTYPGDTYVPKISWRYLLRGIEWARRYGLRVDLDLHALPGSQNGWNHSGRQGPIGWLNGTDGSLNAQRSLDLHTQLSTFFAASRYKNVITIYGLVNEPKMTKLDQSAVVSWTQSAVNIVRKSGMNATIAFGDGFLGLEKWQGELQGTTGLVLDAHEYTIFDPNLIVMNHTAKAAYACEGWTKQMKISMDKTTGFGPTLCGEWSQADTDCTTYLNNVGIGTRWEGTFTSADRGVSVLSPACPSKSSACSCTDANADPSTYSDAYKSWLMTNAEAQMASYETAWGWFYWTWTTEGAAQWDWKKGMEGGFLPKKVWDRGFNCTDDLPSFDGLSENY